jgi:type II secretory pathway component PulK
MSDLIERLKQSEVDREQLAKALQRIVDLYVMNQGARDGIPGEFITCATPPLASSMSFEERRENKYWRAFDDARELLQAVQATGEAQDG